jgi:zinc transporter ZupT
VYLSAGDYENRSHLIWIAVPLAGVTVLSTLAGGLLALRLRAELTTVIAFTGGIVVAVALFDVLPEALEFLAPRDALAFVGAGFVLFFLAERVLVLHHRDEPDQARAHARVGALGAAALSIHSLMTASASASPSRSARGRASSSSSPSSAMTSRTA